MSQGHIYVTFSCFSLISTKRKDWVICIYNKRPSLSELFTDFFFKKQALCWGTTGREETPMSITFSNHYPCYSERLHISPELLSVFTSYSPLFIYWWPERTPFKEVEESLGERPIRCAVRGVRQWDRPCCAAATGPTADGSRWMRSGGCFAGVRGCYTNREHGHAEGFGRFQKITLSPSQAWKWIGCFRASV